jgi:hypothetical protein
MSRDPPPQATTTATAGSPQQRAEEGGSGKQHAVPDLAGTDTAEAQYIWCVCGGWSCWGAWAAWCYQRGIRWCLTDACIS